MTPLFYCPTCHAAENGHKYWYIAVLIYCLKLLAIVVAALFILQPQILPVFLLVVAILTWANELSQYASAKGSK
jgi:hypothetical protein